MSTLKVIQMELGSMANFNYIIGDTKTGDAAVVDPNEQVDALLKAAKKEGFHLSMILLTHGHYDHVGGVNRLSCELKIPTYLSELEAPFYTPQCQDLRRTKDNDTIKLGESAITVIQTPGHTPGGQCFYFDGHLITGDTLFVDAIGRTDFPGGNAKTLFNSLQKIKALPDATRVYPGHNYSAVPNETLGTMKKENPYLACQNERQFLDLAG